MDRVSSAPSMNVGAPLLVVVAAYAALYGPTDAFASEAILHVFRKAVVIPAFAAYALLACRRHEQARFLQGWFPFLAAVVLFETLRGAAFALVTQGTLATSAAYPIAFERWLSGTPSLSGTLQQWRAPWLDLLMIGVHGLHFLFFLVFGLTLWHARRAHFWPYRSAMLIVLGGGLAGYFLVPTAPPWLAAGELGLLPPITRVGADLYRSSPELYRTLNSNPVAAMPSLHAAFPFVGLLVGWRAFDWRVRLPLAGYFVLVNIGAVYLGDHYVIDLMAGWLLAGVACAVAFRWAASPPRDSTRGAALVTAALIVAAVATGWLVQAG
jgi:membrane-associated phospholipid phosphatase